MHKITMKDVKASGDYLFIIKEGSEWRVGHSVHENPRAGFQVLESNMNERSAREFAKKMAKRWDIKVVMTFERTIQNGLPTYKKISQRVAADVDRVIRKVKERMEAWKNHKPDVYKNLVAWFNQAVGRASLQGLPDIDIHLGLNAHEYKTLKQYVVTVRRALV
jgi:osmotically-inducible protein OsmY